MKRMTFVNFLTRLVVCLFTISVPSLGESYSYAHQTPKNAPESSTESSGKCSTLHQLCGAPYPCCPGLQCAPYAQGLYATGFCIPHLPPPLNKVGPIAEKEQPPNECRTTGQLCHPGFDATCCKHQGIDCIVTPKVPGMGVCGVPGVKIMPPVDSILGEENGGKCKKAGQACNSYGAFSCCKGLKCVASDLAGIGACA